MAVNRRVVLAARPSGFPTEADFRLEEGDVPEPRDGEVVVRSHFLSLDPYMRGRMDDVKSYAKPVAIGAVMEGETVGEVVASRSPRFRPGELVRGRTGWQEYGCVPDAALTSVDGRAPLSLYLGALGMPGVTAWVGLVDICAPRAGETVVVSAASGAVGSVVGQLAKHRGCRVVGIAGGPAKCACVLDELGFDACVDYKAGRLQEDLEAALPAGCDVLFENVGGEGLDTMLRLMNAHSRIAVCGLISQYNATQPYGYRNLRSVLVNRIRMQGFIVSDRMELWAPALAELGELHAQGRLRYRQSIAEGIASAPRAFIGMLRGENFGKQLVKLV
jgi:NADPH-dependent curcumin reductase CurA